MNNTEMKSEAAWLVAAYDSGELDWAGYKRTAADLAEFWIESQFARVDIDCDWSDAKCTRMGALMRKELRGLGLA
ncbi:MAG: hypothetical protein EBT03_12950 [Betaproteobacteria bacterium]|nr:hypothetical protein [Betaproteobacteria bacterium]